MSWPVAVIVMDPFHVVALARTKLDLCRQRIQQQTLGGRGHMQSQLVDDGRAEAGVGNIRCRR